MSNKKVKMRDEERWFKDRNFIINLASLIVIIILTVGIYLAQIPKPHISSQLYNKNNTLYVWFFNSGELPALMINFSIFNQDEETLYDYNSENDAPLFISPFLSLVDEDTSINIKVGERYSIRCCYTWKNKIKCLEGKPSYAGNIPSISVGQPISIRTSISILVTRHRDMSIIKFKTPIVEGHATCYIENKEGGDSIYIIDKLNLTTPIIKTNEKYEFECYIENGEVSKIL